MTDDPDHLDRQAILARRSRFVAAALTGLTTSTLATACPCLNVAAPPSTEPEPDGGEADQADQVDEAAESNDGAESPEGDGPSEDEAPDGGDPGAEP